MASTVYYQVGSGDPCNLGHKYDHNATIIHFKGFEMISESNTLYFKLKTNSNNYLIPLINYEWNVTQPATLEAGEFRGQLMEVSVNDEGVSETIQSSVIFKVVIQRSIKDGYEVTDPTLDLWMDKVKTLYDKYVDGGEALDSVVEEVKAIQADIVSKAEEVDAAVSNFTDVTVPAAVNAVSDEKDASIAAVAEQQKTSIKAVDAEGAKEINAVSEEAQTALASIQAVEEDIAENYPKYTEVVEELATCVYIDTEGYICLKEA